MVAGSCHPSVTVRTRQVAWTGARREAGDRGTRCGDPLFSWLINLDAPCAYSQGDIQYGILEPSPITDRLPKLL
jgi:hypothetical protein